jgi:hypothetical protein
MHFDPMHLRDSYRSFLDSIIIELCLPSSPSPKRILFQILHEAVDEAPREAKRFPQAVWDAIGDLSVSRIFHACMHSMSHYDALSRSSSSCKRCSSHLFGTKKVKSGAMLPVKPPRTSYAGRMPKSSPSGRPSRPETMRVSSSRSNVQLARTSSTTCGSRSMTSVSFVIHSERRSDS